MSKDVNTLLTNLKSDESVVEWKSNFEKLIENNIFKWINVKIKS